MTIFEKPARISARVKCGAQEPPQEPHTKQSSLSRWLRDGHLAPDATVNYYNLIGATQWEIITARAQSMVARLLSNLETKK